MALINIDTDLSPDYQTTFAQTAVNPVGNQVFWVFDTDASGDPNAKAQMVLFFAAFFLVSGNSLTITRYGGQSTFVARANPTLYELDTAIVASSQAVDFAQMLSNHPDFKPYYTVVYSGGFIYITARFSGAQYNLNYSVVENTVGTIQSVLISNGTSATQGAELTDFNIKAKLFINTNLNSKVGLTSAIAFDQNDWEEQPQLLQAQYSTDNVMAIDLAESLAPFTFCPPPNINSFVIYTVQDMLVKYYFEIYAQYVPSGSTSPRQFLISSIGKDPDGAKLYAIHSSLPTYTQPVRIHNTYQYFWHRLTTADKVNFLTGCPVEKRTHVDSYEFLYWIYYNIGKLRPTLALRYNFYFEDGTELLNQDTLFAAADRKTAYCAQVGFAKIRQAFGDIETTQGSLLRKFDVRVVENTGSINDVTLPQTFVMDNSTRCFNFNAAQIIFKNQYGGFDSLRCTYTERTTKTKAKAYAKQPTWRSNVPFVSLPLYQQLPIDEQIAGNLGNDLFLSPIGLSTGANYDSANVTEFTLKSGWISAVEMDWLKNSLFSSNEAYLAMWVDPDNLGNPNQRLMRRVIFDERSVSKNQFEDSFNFELTVTTGMPDNALNG